MKRTLLAIVCLLSVLALAGLAQAQDKPLINGIDPDFPPYAFIDKAGVPTGFDVEALDWIAKDQGFQVVHQPTDWATIVVSLTSKKIDLVASGMSITAERAQQVNFTIPYQTIKQVLVAKKDSKLTSESALDKAKKIGVQSGTSEAKWIKENLIDKGGKKFKLVEYPSSALSIEDVLNGRIEAAAMDDAPAVDAVNKGKKIKVLGVFGMPEENFGYAVRKDDADLLAKLNAGLKKLMASPKWQELKTKYEIK
jgi:polar amino acid transport system substrate-binding protein